MKYLTVKAEREAAQQEQKDWSSRSLSAAMRGMENKTPSYILSDLTATFS